MCFVQLTMVLVLEFAFGKHCFDKKNEMNQGLDGNRLTLSFILTSSS